MGTILVALGAFVVRGHRTCVLVFASAAGVVPAAWADSWPAPVVQARSSARGTYVVRVLPGKSVGDVVGFSGAGKGPYAVAEWHRHGTDGYRKVRTMSLLNPVAPVDVEVTETGKLITLDNWHNRGYGHVLAIYTPDGEVLKRYRLPDLYAEHDIRRMRMSTSSIHWRCEGSSFVLDTPRELWIQDSIGGRLRVNVETGGVQYDRGGGSCGK